MSTSKKLAGIFARLDTADQQTLMDFALFLEQKSLNENSKVYAEYPVPKLIERVEGESVIAAIKRLKESYHMLNMDSLLDETSSFVAQYMVQGRDINEVIDDLEASFANHYEKQKAEYFL